MTEPSRPDLPTVSVSVVSGMHEVAAADWDALEHHDSPFLSHAFLGLLESVGAVGKKTAWQPFHLVVKDDRGIAAALPCYVRGDSYGEFIFDWSWAQAAARFGIDYYPKLTSAVPYTPATGPRLLVRKDVDARAMRRVLGAALQEATREVGASSAHVLFCEDDEATALEEDGYLRRKSLQFHWRNDGYASFDDFLSRLNHEDRKNIRRERRRVKEAGVDVEVLLGKDVEPKLWPKLFALYTSTSDRKWGRPYLPKAFFHEAPQVLGDSAVVGLARRGGELIAMTLSFERGGHSYGRYWGCSDEVPGLHFELCYYALIERAILNQQVLVEAGAQGEHKLKRGYLPVVTHSAHRFQDGRFGHAVGRFLREEAAAVDAERDELLAHSPFKADAAPKHPLVAGVPLR